MTLGCYVAQGWAQDETVDVAGESEIEPPVEQRVICRKVVVTGTHFKKRVCRTQAMIDQEAEDAKQFMIDAARYVDALQIKEAIRR